MLPTLPVGAISPKRGAGLPNISLWARTDGRTDSPYSSGAPRLQREGWACVLHRRASGDLCKLHIWESWQSSWKKGMSAALWSRNPGSGAFPVPSMPASGAPAELRGAARAWITCQKGGGRREPGRGCGNCRALFGGLPPLKNGLSDTQINGLSFC